MRKSLSIRLKTILILFVLVAVVIAGGLSTYISLSNVENSIRFISNTLVALNENINDMKYLIMFTQRDILEAAAFRDLTRLQGATGRSMMFHKTYKDTVELLWV